MPGLKERAKTLVELADSAAFLARTLPLAMDAKATALLTPDAKAMLRDVANDLAATDFSAPALDAALRAYRRALRPQAGPGGPAAARGADRHHHQPGHRRHARRPGPGGSHGPPAGRRGVNLPSRHLLAIEGLHPPQIAQLLDLAESYVLLNRSGKTQRDLLRGRTLINLFFEDSTRTRTSFELAGKRLGADVINMSVSSSSVNKGETLLDTAGTLNAMQCDLLVVRHDQSGAPRCWRRRSTRR